MEIIIKTNGQAVTVDISPEVYEFLNRSDHKQENLAHEKRRHWDSRELDEYIILIEGHHPYIKRRRIFFAKRRRLRS